MTRTILTSRLLEWELSAACPLRSAFLEKRERVSVDVVEASLDCSLASDAANRKETNDE